MTVWLYSIIRNEAPILSYFLRHYTPWVDRLIFYDGGSTDGTRELLAACPKAEVREWAGSDGLVDDEFHVFANQQWHEARGKADWVVWVDADEFLIARGHDSGGPGIRTLLKYYLTVGVEVPTLDGYTMFSKTFPTTTGQIYDEVKTGVVDHIWAKPAIFQPHIPLVVNMGRHSINNDAYRPVRSATAEIKLLHYRCLGLEYLRARHARNWARVPARCREMNLGSNTQPGWTENHGVAWFEAMMGKELGEVV